MIQLAFVDEAPCVYAALATVCYYHGIVYDYIFTGLWGFNYLQDGEGNIGNRISLGINNDVGEEILEKKAKIIIHNYEIKSKEELYQIIVERLNQYMPVIISSDLFWCPWSEAYQKYSFQHFYIIIGMDIQSRKIICMDPYLKKNEVVLDENTFWQGYKGCLLYKRDADTYEVNETFMLDKLHEVAGKNCETNIFSQMRQFAYDISYVDFKREIGEGQDLYSVLLFHNIKELAICRRSFKKVLTRINDKHTRYHDALERLDESIKLFKKTHLNLIRYSLAKDYSDDVKQCSSWINDIADIEEKMAHILSGG